MSERDVSSETQGLCEANREAVKQFSRVLASSGLRMPIDQSKIFVAQLSQVLSGLQPTYDRLLIRNKIPGGAFICGILGSD